MRKRILSLTSPKNGFKNAAVTWARGTVMHVITAQMEAEFECLYAGGESTYSISKKFG
ncbi:MAG: hypothetical protein AB1476_06685 [Candidatus Hadarchaeota archaeon]